MSKQFDELYEQAVTIASGELSVWNENWTPKSPKFKYEEVLFKKFGELVVRECAAHLNFVGDDYASTELLEHFGVLE